MDGLRDALKRNFPPTQHTFAYGSGVFKQPGLYDSTSTAPSAGPMVDLIFAVDDPVSWHTQLNWAADSIGSGVYFNTLVPWHAGLIKYGVVSLKTLERDLSSWDTLYLAGRMHKPVKTFSSHSLIQTAQTCNLESALRIALLLLPQKFSMHELLYIICGLSYSGDVRMGLAEDSKKVHRIVEGSYEDLVDMYKSPLRTATTHWSVLEQHGPDGEFVQDCTLAAKAPLLSALPASILQKLAAHNGQHSSQLVDNIPLSSSLAAKRLAEMPQIGGMLRKAVAATVRTSSRRQAALGILSAGGYKSVQYMWRKVQKAWPKK